MCSKRTVTAYGSQRTKLTNFDRLAVWICVLGAGVMGALYSVAVRGARRVYTDLDDLLPGLTKIVMSPGFSLSMLMLMLFFAYYGVRMRRAYDNRTASFVLFLGILTSLSANGLLIWALYSPASNSLRYLG